LAELPDFGAQFRDDEEIDPRDLLRLIVHLQEHLIALNDTVIKMQQRENERARRELGFG
jgi:hypothetical protein